MNDAVLQIGDIAEVVAGDPAPQAPRAFAPDGPLFVRMRDVGRCHRHPFLSESADRLSTEWLAQNNLRLFPKDSVLIPKSGASVNLNHRAKLGREAYVVSHLAVLIPNRTKVHPDYLYWWSVAYDPRDQVRVTSLPSLKLSTIKAATIRLPPLEEQRRIVVILNRAAKIERLCNLADEGLREFVSSVFVRMFGDPSSNPMEWEVRSLRNYCLLMQYGTSTKANRTFEGVPVLRIGNVTTQGNLDCADLKHVVLSDSDLKKYALEAGDILFNRTNSKELVGKTGIWDGRFPAVAASYFIRLRLDAARMCPTYVWAWMNSHAMKQRLFLLARGAIGQANINARELGSLAVPVPPVARQRHFAKLVESARTAMATSQAGSAAAADLSAALGVRLLGGRA